MKAATLPVYLRVGEVENQIGWIAGTQASIAKHNIVELLREVASQIEIQTLEKDFDDE